MAVSREPARYKLEVQHICHCNSIYNTIVIICARKYDILDIVVSVRQASPCPSGRILWLVHRAVQRLSLFRSFTCRKAWSEMLSRTPEKARTRASLQLGTPQPAITDVLQETATMQATFHVRGL
jgi:hypothetical protein